MCSRSISNFRTNYTWQWTGIQRELANGVLLEIR